MYGERRYTPSSSRQSYGRHDNRSNQTSSQRKDQKNHSTPSSGQFVKPVEKESIAEPVYSSEDSVVDKNVEENANYQYEEVYVEADCIGYDETSTEKAAENVPIKHETENQLPVVALPEEKGLEPMGSVNQQQETNLISNQVQINQQMNSGESNYYPEYDPNFNDGKRMIDLNSLIKPYEKKFSGRGRLFIANLQNNITEEDVANLFGKFGETNEIYVNKDKGFGFVRMDYKINAEIAKNALDGLQFKTRFIKVRFAAHQSAIEIHGIDRFCSNESLESAFNQFGVVERARVACDERGKSKGYAIIEFAFKKSAQIALHKINEGLFVLGRLPKPVTARALTQIDEDGIHEKDLERVPGIMKDREYQARFILPDTPEYDFAKQWKELDAAGKQQKETLEKQLEEEKDKLEIEIETSVHENEADYIRQELLQRQAALEDEIRRYDEMLNASRNRQAANAITQSLSNARRNEEARKQDEFIKKQQQEIMRRQGTDDVMREMQNAAATVGMAGINKALAMAAGGPASAAANLLQAHAAVTQAMQGRDSRMPGNRGMHRMPGPRGPMHGMGPRGMMGPGEMRPMFDSGHGRGNMRPGIRRQGPPRRDGPYGNKRPRK